MADSRILHRSAGDSEKVAALSDLEYRVWTQYVLSADDFGVMPASAFVLQADNRALRQRPTKTIQKALEAVIVSGLVAVFIHQGERYVWQPDWNDWQGLRHPRQTVRPLPQDYSIATTPTVKLFSYHPTLSPQDSGKVSEKFQTPAGADTRETLTLTQTLTPAQTQTPEGSVRETTTGPMGGSGTLIDGRAQRRHGEHASPATCAIGACVHASQHDEFTRKLSVTGGKGPDGRTLREFYTQEADAIIAGGVLVGDDVFDFWRNRFAAWVGTVSEKPQKRATKPQPAYNGDWRDECARLHNSECGKQYTHGLRMANEIADFMEPGKKAAS